VLRLRLKRPLPAARPAGSEALPSSSAAAREGACDHGPPAPSRGAEQSGLGRRAPGRRLTSPPAATAPSTRWLPLRRSARPASRAYSGLPCRRPLYLNELVRRMVNIPKKISSGIFVGFILARLPRSQAYPGGGPNRP